MDRERVTDLPASGGVVSPFDAPFGGAAGATFGTGISQTGTTVGYFFDATSAAHGFVNSGGYSQIDAPAANGTFVNGVNAAGTTVGYYTDATGMHGFIRSAGGVYTAVNVPAGVNGTVVTGINNLGEITGFYIDASNVTHGFVEIDGDFVTIDAPGSLEFTEVTGVNDLGEIVGEDIDAATGLVQGFVATVPEPTTLSVLGLGAFALLNARRRRTI